MNFKFSQLKDIFFCTGARNHDLLGCMKNPIFELDERIASFKALGTAKITLNPSGICTTSGTAVAECLPAMIEAYYSNLPFVLITGDRPSKQHGTGAPQTISHEELTRSCRRSFFEIPSQDLANFSVMDIEYPLHINVIVDDTVSHSEAITQRNDLEEFSQFLQSSSRPLFLFSHEEKNLRPIIEKFQKTSLPFYAETLSGAHDLSPIPNEFSLLKLFKAGAFDSVVRIGHTPLSKIWRLLETQIIPVWSFDSRGLSGLSYGNVFKSSALDLLSESEFWKILQNVSPWEWDKKLTNKSLENLCVDYPDSEISLMSRIAEKIPEDAYVYLGNSLVIRNFETVQKKKLRVFGNRGVNGIDGQLSTAIGMASNIEENLYCILGDLTLRYDLTALSDLPENLRLIVINNHGGRIFESLNLDERIILSHEKTFAKEAQAFNLRYSTKIEDIHTSQLIEVFTNLTESRKMLKELRS